MDDIKIKLPKQAKRKHRRRVDKIRIKLLLDIQWEYIHGTINNIKNNLYHPNIEITPTSSGRLLEGK